jgi:hypothetical protein
MPTKEHKELRKPGGFNCIHPLGSLESMRAKLAQYNTDETEIIPTTCPAKNILME